MFFVIPIGDENPRRRIPLVNILLIVANVLIFLGYFFKSHQELNAFILEYALVPKYWDIKIFFSIRVVDCPLVSTHRVILHFLLIPLLFRFDIEVGSVLYLPRPQIQKNQLTLLKQKIKSTIVFNQRPKSC